MTSLDIYQVAGWIIVVLVAAVIAFAVGALLGWVVGVAQARLRAALDRLNGGAS